MSGHKSRNFINILNAYILFIKQVWAGSIDLSILPYPLACPPLWEESRMGMTLQSNRVQDKHITIARPWIGDLAFVTFTFSFVKI